MARQKLRQNRNQLHNRKKQGERVNYRTLLVENETYKTLLTEKYLRRKPYQEKDIRNIEAFIPGRIVKILVAKGHTVSKGDTLLILEAMKMNNKIMAPMDGVIKKINVKENDRIPKDHLLITLK